MKFLRPIILLSFMVASLLAQQWAPIPGTTLTSACPANGYAASTCTGDNTSCPGGGVVGVAPYNFAACGGATSAWNGGVARTKPGSEAFILPAQGGHADYGGNEVYSINVGTHPGVARITNPDHIDTTLYYSVLSTQAFTVNVGGAGNTTVTSTGSGDFTSIALNPSGTTSLQGFPVAINGVSYLVASVQSATQLTLYQGPSSPLTGATLQVVGGMNKFVNPQGRPVSRHTYSASVYIDQNSATYPDSVMTFGGGTYGNGRHMNTAWLLRNLDSTPTWTLILPNPAGWQPVAGVSAPAPQATYDPSTGRVYLLWDGFVAYLDLSTCTGTSPLTCTYTRLSVGSEIGWQTPVLDTTRHRLFLMGAGSPTGTGYAFTVDLTAGSQPVDVTSSIGSACSPLLNSEGPGVAYDPKYDLYIGWPVNSAGTVYYINPSTFACTAVTYGGTPAPTTSNVNGLYTRSAYFPSLGQLVLINDGAQNAYSLQLEPPGIGTPQHKYTCVDHDGDGYGVGPLQVGPYTDLAIDATTSTLVSSASHSFTASDVGSTISISGGAGFTQQDALIVSVSGGKATVATAAGTAGSTGGQWQVSGCLGSDANDEDASVHTATQAISAYGSVPATYNRRRYMPARYWLIDPTHGNDSSPGSQPYTISAFAGCTGAGNCGSYQHFWALRASIQPGDAVVFRGGPINEPIAPISGSPGQYVYYLSYPGEEPYLNTGAGVNWNIISVSWIVMDGISTFGYTPISGGNNTNVILRHIHGNHAPAAYWNNSVVNWWLEDSSFHDIGGTHGVYMGGFTLDPDRNMNILRDLIYRNGLAGIHSNGPCTGCTIANNIIYSNSLDGIDVQNGFSHGTISSNLIFNNARGITWSIYNSATNCAPDPSNTCGSPTDQYVCPVDQNYNLIENNTFYNSDHAYNGDGTWNTAQPPAIYWGAQCSAYPRDQGHQTYRNNILVSGVDTSHLPIRVNFNSSVDPGASSETPWLASSTFDHNILIATASSISNVLFFQDMAPSSPGNVAKDCTGMASYTTFPNGASMDCRNVSPNFTDVSTAYYNQSLKFDFTLASGSPAIHTGAGSTGQPGTPPAGDFDVMGNPFASIPSLGAYEVPTSSSSALPPPPPATNACDLNGDGVVNSLDVQLAINEVTGSLACGSASLEGNGLCTIVDVQRIVNASLGGSCKTGQ